MRKLLILIVASVAWAAPALAQDTPNDRADASADQGQDALLSQTVQSVERNVKAHLALVGFTDIEMIPTSFLVRAKDRDGYPVMLVVSPDSIANLNEVDPGQQTEQNGDSTSEAPSGQSPAVTFPGATDGE